MNQQTDTQSQPTKIKYSQVYWVYFMVATLFVMFNPLKSPHAATHDPQAFLKQIAGTVNEGEQIVQQYCSSCHAENPLIPLGAPRPGNAADWKARMNQGIEILFRHSDEGFNAMPARGGCFECSDEQLMLAISALLPKE